MLFPTFETPILRAVITPSMTSTVNECDEVIWSVLIFGILCTCSILIQHIYLHTAYEQQFPQQSKRVQIANEDSTKNQHFPGRHYNRSISPQWLSMPAKQDQHAKSTATVQHLWRNQWHSWTTPNYLYLLKFGLTSETQHEIIDIFGPWFRKRLKRHKNFRYPATQTEKLPKISRVKTSVFGTSSVDKTKMQCQVNAYLFLDIFLIRDLPSLSPATTIQLSVEPPCAFQRRKRERTPEGHFPKGTSIPLFSHSALSREFFVIYFFMSWIIGSILLTCYSFHFVGRGNKRGQGNTLRTRYPPRANGRELPTVFRNSSAPSDHRLLCFPTNIPASHWERDTDSAGQHPADSLSPARQWPRTPHSPFRDPSATSYRHLLCFPDNIPAIHRERGADPAGQPPADSLPPAHQWSRTPSIISGPFFHA